MSLMSLLHSGGFAMYPLLIFSVIIWAIAFERYYFLRIFTKHYLKTAQDVEQAVKSNHYDELKVILRNVPSAIAKPHQVVLDAEGKELDQLSDKINRKLSETQSELKKNIWIIGTVSNAAPFVGLFGTVLGVMSSFQSIGAAGKSGFSVVAGGISESLIATAVGILVAVVATIFYNFFQTKINQINLDFKNKLADSTDLILNAQKNRK